MLGANPLASNGSLLTAPDMRGRLRGIRERGGKVVVVDPRRSRTAEHADEHHFIRPGTDAHLLLGMLNVIVEEGLTDLGDVAAHVERARGGPGDRPRVHPRGGVARRAGSSRPRSAAWRASWPPPTRRRLRADRHLHPGVRDAGELAGRRAERRDRQPRPPGRRDVHEGRRRLLQHARHPGQGQGDARRRAGTPACAACPRRSASCPVAGLAEEIDTPGDGQVRALFTLAGNPS